MRRFGLRILKPYPNPDDVCGVDKTSPPTELAAKYGQLIACPKHEKGALGDCIREGAIELWHMQALDRPEGFKDTQTQENSRQSKPKLGIRRLFPMMIFMGPKLNIAIPKVGYGWFIQQQIGLPGRWKLDDDHRLCHKYFIWNKPRNCVVGYEWECASKVYEHVSTKDYKILLGDPFKLYRRAGRIPSVDLSAKFRLENSGSCSILNRLVGV